MAAGFTVAPALGTIQVAGTFALENLKAGPWFGPWFFVYEEPTGAPTIVGPVTITSKDRSMKVDIAIAQGGTIEGRVANVPTAMAGQVWVIAFDATTFGQGPNGASQHLEGGTGAYARASESGFLQLNTNPKETVVESVTVSSS